MALGRLGSYITLVSGPFHPFGGAIDIVVVQQPDGTFKSSPWYVRFGKFQGVLKSREKIVNILVNGEEASFHMYLDTKGEAFFLRDADTDAEGECSGVGFAMSLVSSGDERDDKMGKIEKSQLYESQTLNMQVNESYQVSMDQRIESAEKLDKDENGQLNRGQIVQNNVLEGNEDIKVNDSQIIKRTQSEQGNLFQRMFRRRSSRNKSTAGVGRINSLERAEMAADLMEMKWSTNLSMNDRRQLESNSESLGLQHESFVTSEPVHVKVVEEEVKVQSSKLSSVDLDSHDNMFVNSTKVDATVDLGSGDEGSQVETSVKPYETMDISVVEEVLEKVQSTEVGNEDLSCHRSLLTESQKVDFRAREIESLNLECQDENSLKDGELEKLGVVQDVFEVHSTEASSAGLDLHQSGAVEREECLSAVESDSCTLGIQDENLVKNSELVNIRAKEQLVGVPSIEAGVAGLNLHDSLATVSKGTDVIIELGSVHVPSLSDITGHEVFARKVDAGSSNLSSEDQNLVATSFKEMANCVSEHIIVEEEISGVRITDLDSLERSLAAIEENARVISDPIDAASVHLEQVGAGENGTLENNQVVATDLLELYKQENCDSPGKNYVLQKHVSEENPRIVTVNSKSADLLDSYSTTISTETSSYTSLTNVLKVSSGDVLPEPTDLTLDEPQRNENFRVQKLNITDVPVKSSNLELSSPTDKCGDNINQNLLNEGNICKMKLNISLLTNELESTSPLALSNLNGLKDKVSICGVSVPESSEELQFDFSDDERELDSERKNEITNVATLSINEKETPGNEIEEANASDSECRFETNPISIPGTDSTRNESMARSLPNIQFDRPEQIERLSCSLEAGEVKKEKDSLSAVLNGDSHSSSNPSKIKCESGTVHDETLLDIPDEKSATVSPLVELSICKHMLSEGMGEDAARQAFDSQKITLQKFRELGPSNLIKNDKLVVRIGGNYFPYEAAAHVVLGLASFGEPAEELLNLKDMIRVKRVDPTKSIVRAGTLWRLLPFGFKRSKSTSTYSVVEESVDSNLDECEGAGANGKSDRKKVRSLVPTSEELASLNLKEGRNVITFTFSTAMLGKQQVEARIYLWKWSTRIVISDVDGTITRSDVLGQFMPLVGVDWSQTGVAHLFSAIKDNGYQLMFLSARAISQAHLTRQFLFSIKQDGKALPDGPVVISPDGLFPSLYREVIRRAPHEFKISCLEAIKALFPADCNPFYAGFGNRDTDEISYLKVGIPMGKIFIINPKGEVAVHRRVDTKSYSSLHALVNGMFPPYSSIEQEGFNDINFWRLPLPVVDL